ncbi:MAG: serine protease [Lentilitoribacter sp.]
MTPIPVKDLKNVFQLQIMNYLSSIIIDQVPELKQDLPSFNNSVFNIQFDESICIATIQFKDGGIPSFGTIESDEFTKLKCVVGSARDYSSLSQKQELAERFGWDRTLIAVDVENEVINWASVACDLVSWANDEPLSRAVRINESRVKRALPTPPQYSLIDIEAAMWVLECDVACTQGTAFDLEGFGTITNEHVLNGTSNLMAFRPDNISRKYPVSIKKSNKALDLAIIEIKTGEVSNGLKPSGSEVCKMGHLAVCGFPNYCYGDSGILSPGIVVGFRMKSGVRRLLTNAGIVSGMSGGPAIAEDNRVVGICVTGSDYMQESRETEDQSIIPVSALDLLD